MTDLPPPSTREQTPAARREIGNARRLWRRDLLARAVSGETRQSLAEARIEDDDLAAAYELIQLLPLLDSFDDKPRCLTVG